MGADVKNDERIVAKMRDCFDARAATGPPNDFIVAVLAYLMKHLASVAKITENKASGSVQGNLKAIIF